MLAKDVMTTNVVTVQEDTRIEEIVRTLLRWRISAVPVVNDDGRVVGIVSEGDLVRRAESSAETGGSWWLSGLIAPEERAREYAKTHGFLARDVMTTPVITAREDDTLGKLAVLLEQNRIKRVPITRNGQLVGIVSRANLLHGVAASPAYGGQTHLGSSVGANTSASSPSDESTRAAITNCLHNDIGVGHHINVIVSDGVVDLWGGVETDAERQAVRAAAENTPGVRAVHDHLSVLAPALRHLLGADRAGKRRG